MVLKNPMFIEVLVRVNGKDKYVDFRKLFDYMITEYSKVKYDGKKVDPYPDRVVTFYDNIPKDLIAQWKDAYPNVDIEGECKKAKVWLLSNTNKIKKNFRKFTNNWLSRAGENGGSIPVVMEHKIEKKIQEHKRYVEEATENSATEEEKQEILSDILTKLSRKKKVKK